MSTVLRRNRKASDRDILRLTSLGLSLTFIAQELNCHPTSITIRLKSLNTPPTDTRHSFMEGVLMGMHDGEPDTLADLFEDNPSMNIRDYIRDLIQKDLAARAASKAPKPMTLGDLEKFIDEDRAEGHTTETPKEPE